MAANLDPDAVLMLRVKRGDRRAFEELVDKYKRPVANAIYRMLGDATEAEDVAQNVFVQVYKSAHRYRASAKFSTWLFTIARNLVRDRARSRKGRRDVVSIEEWHAVTEHDALDTAVADETAARMRRAVATLTPMQRDVFTLRVTEGMSYKEIAAVVASTEGAARVHYHNAMRAIKEFLG